VAAVSRLRTPGARQRGFTLLEMVVALAVVGVALLLSAGLFKEAYVLQAAAGRQLDDPLADVATARLRLDVQGSHRILGGLPTLLGPLWTGEPLELEGYFPDTVLRYEQVGGELHRVVLDAGGEELSREVWMRRVVLWRWRPLSPRLLEVEVTYRRGPEASDWRLAGGPPVPPPDRLETERLRLALRGRGSGAGW
jgi:prepilin-type N-terminal cleavage/methylation domain-containing protein